MIQRPVKFVENFSIKAGKKEPLPDLRRVELGIQRPIIQPELEILTRKYQLDFDFFTSSDEYLDQKEGAKVRFTDKTVKTLADKAADQLNPLKATMTSAIKSLETKILSYQQLTITQQKQVAKAFLMLQSNQQILSNAEVKEIKTHIDTLAANGANLPQRPRAPSIKPDPLKLFYSVDDLKELGSKSGQSIEDITKRFLKDADPDQGLDEKTPFYHKSNYIDTKRGLSLLGITMKNNMNDRYHKYYLHAGTMTIMLRGEAKTVLTDIVTGEYLPYVIT